MKIAVLSGKGGTGKTLLSVNLASVLANATYIDCDVEEPNGHLFFKPHNIYSEKVSVRIPFVDEQNCKGCRKCIDFCKFNALAYISSKVMVFDEVCHACGGCVLLCPEKAISEREKVIGTVEKGKSEDVTVYTGILNAGEASGVPIINKLLSVTEDNKNQVFIDCPPGSSCAVMESIKNVDYCILVTEPTVFGVHNLNMVYELVKLFNKPHGAVLNKCLEGINPAEEFCLNKGIKILGRIPFDHYLGTLNSDARIAARERGKYHNNFSAILERVLKEEHNETAVNP